MLHFKGIGIPASEQAHCPQKSIADITGVLILFTTAKLVRKRSRTLNLLMAGSIMDPLHFSGLQIPTNGVAIK